MDKLKFIANIKYKEIKIKIIKFINFFTELGEPKKSTFVAILSNPVLLGTLIRIRIIKSILKIEPNIFSIV
jgi:hypothetical protein